MNQHGRQRRNKDPPHLFFQFCLKGYIMNPGQGDLVQHSEQGLV
jgi:hypothetical protein